MWGKVEISLVSDSAFNSFENAIHRSETDYYLKHSTTPLNSEYTDFLLQNRHNQTIIYQEKQIKDLFHLVLRGVNYKKVSERKTTETKTSWILLPPSFHLGTGFRRKHVDGERIFGYHLYGNKSSFVVIDIDAHHKIDKETVIQRYYEIVEKLGEPSFVIRSSDSGGIHMYYCFEKSYYIKDLIASFKAVLGNIQSVDILPRVNCPIRMPFGVGSCLLDKSEPYYDYSHIDKYKQIEILLDHFEPFTDISEVVPHIKVNPRFKSNYKQANKKAKADRNKNGVMTNFAFPEIAFIKGNSLNSLIQLFNRHVGSQDNFIAACTEELKKVNGGNNISERFLYLTLEKQLNICESFYTGMLETRLKDNETNLDEIKYKVNYSMPERQMERLINIVKKTNYYRKLSYTGLKKSTVQRNCIRFMEILINEFYKQALYRKSATTYSVPSLFLKEVDARYQLYWPLFIQLFTAVSSHYCNAATGYYCRKYSLKRFRQILILLQGLIKVKVNDSGCYEIQQINNDTESNTNQLYINSIALYKKETVDQCHPPQTLRENHLYMWIKWIPP